MKRKAMLLAALTVVSAILVGCGGGNDYDNNRTSAIPLPATQMRAVVAGDKWTYSITGTARAIDQTTDSVVRTVSGQYVLTAAPQTVTAPDTQVCRVYTESMTLHIVKKTTTGTTAIDTTTNTRLFIYQDASGNMWRYGGTDAGGNDYWLTSPASGRVLLCASPLADGATWSGDYVTSMSKSYSENRTIERYDKVRAAAETFSAWKATGAGSICGLPATFTQWIAPEISGPVIQEVKATDSGQALTLDMVMELVQHTQTD